MALKKNQLHRCVAHFYFRELLLKNEHRIETLMTHWILRVWFIKQDKGDAQARRDLGHSLRRVSFSSFPACVEPSVELWNIFLLYVCSFDESAEGEWASASVDETETEEGGKHWKTMKKENFLDDLSSIERFLKKGGGWGEVKLRL